MWILSSRRDQFCRLKERTKEADANAARASLLLEEKAAEARVLMAQLQQAQKEGQSCKARASAIILIALFRASIQHLNSESSEVSEESSTYTCKDTKTTTEIDVSLCSLQ